MLKAYAVALVLSVSTPVAKNDGAKKVQKQENTPISQGWKPRSIGL